MVYEAMLECNHDKNTSLTKALLYCLAFSILFVLSLYIIVPANIRKLPRNDTRQIKWRFVSVISTSILSICFYPLCFCQDEEVIANDEILPAFAYMGIVGWLHWKSSYIKVLLHTAVLFLGPLFVMLFRAYLKTTTTVAKRWDDGRGFFSIYFEILYYDTIHSYLPFCATHIRDYIIAPLTEEVVFRGCMANPLLSAGMNAHQVTFLAPIFFGTAHLHHAYEKLSRGMPLKVVVVQNTVQFLVTYVFGAYSMYVFIKVGSIFVVTLCHSFCNIMGLPELEFMMNRYSELFPYRKMILAIHALGVLLFVMGFLFGQEFLYDDGNKNIFTRIQRPWAL